MANRACRYTVWLDHQISRRKHYHIVTGDDGEVVFRHREAGQCLDWLRSEGVMQYTLVTDRWAIFVGAKKSVEAKEYDPCRK